MLKKADIITTMKALIATLLVATISSTTMAADLYLKIAPNKAYNSHFILEEAYLLLGKPIRVALFGQSLDEKYLRSTSAYIEFRSIENAKAFVETFNQMDYEKVSKVYFKNESCTLSKGPADNDSLRCEAKATAVTYSKSFLGL